MQVLCQLSYSPDRLEGTSGPQSPERSVGDWDPLQAGSIPPQALEVVIAAGLWLEDVNHEIPIIHQHPLGLREAFVPQGLPTMLFEQFLHPFRQRLNVGARSPGGNHEYLGNYEEVSDLEQGDVESLLVGDGIGSQPG